MAVMVTLTSRGSDGFREQSSVGEGHTFAVRDGALVVLDNEVDGRSVAIFAPGSWLSAQVDEG